MSVPLRSAHITDLQMDRFRGGTLPAAELVVFSDHVAECPDCRGRFHASGVVEEGLGAIERGLADLVDHVSEEDVQAYVDGRLEARQRLEIERHLAACAMCAAEIRDLQAFKKQDETYRRRWPAYAGLAAAAVVVAAVGLSVFVSQEDGRRLVIALADTEGTVGVDDAGNVTGIAGLTAQEADTVRQALTTGRVALPSTVSALRGTAGTLMGDSVRATFQVRAPIGTVVREERPTFRWTPAPEAVQYIVTLHDETSGEAINSPALQTTDWTPATPLTRGRTYTWQVTAVIGGRELLVPAPPAPPARFAILDAESVQGLERLPASHAVRGILYANAGLMDDAERELAALAALNATSTTAAALLKQLQDARGQ